MSVNIVLCDKDEKMCHAWEDAVKQHDLPLIETRHGNILRAGTDAIVSPANSFGCMDGGLDLLIASRWPGIERQVKQAIGTRMFGELLVGQAILIPTGTNDIRFLAVAPTMRAPMKLPEGSLAPYLSTRAAILLVEHVGWQNSGRLVSADVKSLAIPGMGAGVGGMPKELVARQMVAAIRMSRENIRMPVSGQDAAQRHWALVRGE